MMSSNRFWILSSVWFSLVSWGVFFVVFWLVEATFSRLAASWSGLRYLIWSFLQLLQLILWRPPNTRRCLMLLFPLYNVITKSLAFWRLKAEELWCASDIFVWKKLVKIKSFLDSFSSMIFLYYQVLVFLPASEVVFSFWSFGWRCWISTKK